MTSNITVKADSGFDSDYSSSSSYNSRDYRSNRESSYSNYKESDHKPTKEEIIIEFITIGGFITITTIVVKKKLKKMNNHYDEVYERVIKEEEKKIRGIEECFDGKTIDEITKEIYDKYKEIQIAWMNFDYDVLNKCCTKELYNRQ